jgi:hypothetical protein
VYLGELAMTSDNDGWAVGSSSGGAGQILRYQGCHWTRLSDSYPNTTLISVSMGSSTDGWAVGGSSSVPIRPLALHYTGGKWRQADISMPAGIKGEFSEVRMLSANEGWILVAQAKDERGLVSFSLLQYRNGAWRLVTAPLGIITDIAPVGPDDLWIVGEEDELHPTQTLFAHYQSGTWSTVAAPVGTQVSHLRAKSPTDIYAMESFPGETAWQSTVTPVVLRYDGVTWTRLPLSGRSAGEVIEMVSATDGWAFHLAFNDQTSLNYHIAGTEHLSGAIWQSAALPTHDITAVQSLTRMTDGSYWAIGNYSNAASVGTLFLRYANGAWSQYGHV